MSRLAGLARMAWFGAVILLISDVPAWAQCSMCRTALEGQGPNAAGVVNMAIVILLFPAVALFSGVFLVAFRNGDPADSEAESEEGR
jgi:hypothetical protein